MTKQKLIEQINELRTCKGWNDKFADVTDMVSKEDVLRLVEQLSEPKKVVIPKFVAEWIEYRKFDRETISNFLRIITFPTDVSNWYYEDEESRKEVLFRAWLDGYEVEKEQLYTVEIPNPNNTSKNVMVLRRLETGIELTRSNSQTYRDSKHCQLTESEIKQDFGWAWDAGFAKEVEILYEGT